MGVLFGVLWAGCGGGAGFGGGVLPSGAVGSLVARPEGNGRLFFIDDHRGGGRSALGLSGVTWGRLVDVFDVDPSGKPSPAPLLQDLVVDPDLISDGVRYRLEVNPGTGGERLIVLRTHGAPPVGGVTFEQLVRDAQALLAPVLPRAAGGITPGPFSLVPRNATLVLQFDDLLLDDEGVADSLADRLGLLTGLPPTTPFEVLPSFDPNHGDVLGGRFHSTRVLLRTTVSEAEASSSSVPIRVNAIGLPESLAGSGDANATLRIPTRVDASAGSFRLLRNLSGKAILPEASPPFDATSPARELLRAFRTGNDGDINRGFLLDVTRPRLIGGFGLDVVSSTPVAGTADRFRADIEFTTPCVARPSLGDALEVAGSVFEVSGGARVLSGGGVRDIELRRVAGDGSSGAAGLLGHGFLRLPYGPGLPVSSGCWWTLVPAAGAPPIGDVSSFSSFEVRFDEPMVAGSFRAFDSMRLVRGAAGAKASARNLVVASVHASRDLRSFTLTPLLPLDNRQGGTYRLELLLGPGNLLDLAGNTPALVPDRVHFLLDPEEPAQENGGIVFRFSSLDELDPFGETDLRGQFTLDSTRETIRPRPLEFFSAACDSFGGAPSVMLPFPKGVQTPLSPLGSRLQSMWRYVDFGWQVRDESKYNIDVIGMSWSPVGGVVLSDFFPRFEMRVGHSRKLPDEECNPARGPSYPASGLADGTVPFSNNEFTEPLAAMRTVHPESFGYRIDSSNVYLNEHRVPMIPFPWNRSGNAAAPVTYTWRDTAIQALGGSMGAGLPMAIEEGGPLFVEESFGDLAKPDEVPSIGLPLLWEVRCFPTASGIGLNPLTIRLGCLGWATPNFRSFSTGGVNVNGRTIQVDPSLEEYPSGGFNPSSQPPGKRTARQADNSFYVGELDYVVRVSRIHTAWLDTVLLAPRYIAPVLEPPATAQPTGTSIVFDYRGADGFTSVGRSPFDADGLDAYGDLAPGRVLFHGPDPSWSNSISSLDGARYFQVRLSLIGNMHSGAIPEIDSLGFAFLR
ncbi:MAG TPA: hypothetical protein ENJ09_15635 [Planctomycetes bacterium]|nr:hypothetical protein [Planctomycetota bacterium]